MRIEDARPQIAEAVDLLHGIRDKLGLPDLRIVPMLEFLKQAESHALTIEEKYLILDQAAIVLDEFYAHLPFKRARYAADPVQRLRLLRGGLEQLDELEFHGEVVKTFSRLRDPHTFYALPEPFAGAFAFLPFRLQHYFDEDGTIRFIVTKVIEGFDHPAFRTGAHVTHYNGMPVEDAVWRDTGLDSAGNEDAQFLRGLNSLFGRPLDNSAPRTDEWVVLEYLPAECGETAALGILLPWNVMTGFQRLAPAGGTRTSIFTTSAQTDASRQVLWGRQNIERIRNTEEFYGQADLAAPGYPRPANESRLPALFSFTAGTMVDEHPACPVRANSLTDPDHPEKKFSYLRIHSFNTRQMRPFTEECRRILVQLNREAPDGLILDVRSNPGGNIAAAECVLQMLTPREIQPAQFHFKNSRLTREIALQLAERAAGRGAALLEFREWQTALAESLADGSVLTPGRPLTSVSQANEIGQIYQGPVVLLIDALSYSATDIFAAGFTDNEIGQVIGVDRNTGGGGANRWLHGELLANTQGLDHIPLKPLPRRSAIGVAIRRMTRVGANTGNAVEDVGVPCGMEFLHKRTREDVLQDDRDLLRKACMHLGTQPSYHLSITGLSLQQVAVHATLKARGIHRLECYLNGSPQSSQPAPPPNPETGLAEFSIRIPTAGLAGNPSQVRIKGFTFEEIAFAPGPSLAAAEAGRRTRAALAGLGVAVPKVMKLVAATTDRLA